MENIGIGAGLAAIAFWGFVAAIVVTTYWDTIRKRDAHLIAASGICITGNTSSRHRIDYSRRQFDSLAGGAY